MEYKDYLRWHQLALKFLGLWPNPGYGLFYTIYSIIFLGLFCVLFNVSEFISFFYIYEDLQPFAAQLSWFLVHLVTSFKIVVFLSKIEDVRRICDRFRTGLFILSSDSQKVKKKEDQIFGQAVKSSVRYLVVYYALSAAVLFNGFVAPIYQDGGGNDNSNSNTTQLRKLPYYTYVICDAQKSPCYEIAYIYQTLSTCVFSLVIIHCDNLYIFLVILCCSEFRILRRSVETITLRAKIRCFTNATQNNPGNKYAGNLGLRRGTKLCEDEIDRESLRLGTNCVKHHHAVLEVSEELEGMYNLLILAQFLSHLIQLCFQMFLVTEVSALSFDGLSMIAFVIAMVIEVYVFCRCGNDIETESTRVSEAAYNAQWTSSSRPVK